MLRTATPQPYAQLYGLRLQSTGGNQRAHVGQYCRGTDGCVCLRFASVRDLGVPGDGPQMAQNVFRNGSAICFVGASTTEVEDETARAPLQQRIDLRQEEQRIDPADDEGAEVASSDLVGGELSL